MSKVKTAISIQDYLFQEMDALAHKTHIPRSNLFEKAVGDFLERQKNQQILKELNAVYSTAPSTEEKRWQRGTRLSHKKILEKNNGY